MHEKEKVAVRQVAKRDTCRAGSTGKTRQGGGCMINVTKKDLAILVAVFIILQIVFDAIFMRAITLNREYIEAIIKGLLG